MFEDLDPNRPLPPLPLEKMAAARGRRRPRIAAAATLSVAVALVAVVVVAGGGGGGQRHVTLAGQQGFLKAPTTGVARSAHTADPAAGPASTVIVTSTTVPAATTPPPANAEPATTTTLAPISTSVAATSTTVGTTTTVAPNTLNLGQADKATTVTVHVGWTIIITLDSAKDGPVRLHEFGPPASDDGMLKITSQTKDASGNWVTVLTAEQPGNYEPLVAFPAAACDPDCPPKAGNAYWVLAWSAVIVVLS